MLNKNVDFIKFFKRFGHRYDSKNHGAHDDQVVESHSIERYVAQEQQKKLCHDIDDYCPVEHIVGVVLNLFEI